MLKKNSQHIYQSGMNISKFNKVRSASNTPFNNTVKSIASKKIPPTQKNLKDQIQFLSKTQNQKKNTNKFDSTGMLISQKENKSLQVQQNMLNKLLLPPPRRTLNNNTSKKQSEYHLSQQNVFGNNNGKKFEQKKPDIETLIHQNNLMKKQIQQLNKNLLNNKIRERQLENKVKKLEDQKIENTNEIISKIQNDKNINVLVEILRKKMHDIQVKLINAEEQIRKLRKLPNASIFQQNNIQKQHYMAETIRLKAILNSYEQNTVQNSQVSHQKIFSKNSQNEALYQTSSNTPEFCSQKKYSNGVTKQASLSHQFLQMLKQQNQKLKSTIRLLQNEKVLIKSHNKLYKDKMIKLTKQFDSLKLKIQIKQSEIQKLTCENKNLLFKKANQLKLQQQSTENRQIKLLQKQLEVLESRCRKLQDQNQLLTQDNAIIKQKQKNKNLQLVQKQTKYENMRLEMAEMQSRYEQRIKSLQIGKMQNNYDHKNSAHFRNSRMFKSSGTFMRNQAAMFKAQRVKKQIKFNQIKLCLLILYTLKKQSIIKELEELFKTNRTDSHIGSSEFNNRKRSNSQQQAMNSFAIKKQFECLNNSQKNNQKVPQIITYSYMKNLLQKPPINLPQYQAQKLTRYVFSDLSVPANQNQLHSIKQFMIQGENIESLKKQRIMDKNLILNILKASLSRFLACLSNKECLNSWKCILNKNQRFLSAFQKINQQSQSKSLKVDQFIKILIQHKKTEITEEQIDFISILAFDCKQSNHQIILDINKIIEVLKNIGQNNENAVLAEPQSVYSKTNTTNKTDKVQQLYEQNVQIAQQEQLLGSLTIINDRNSSLLNLATDEHLLGLSQLKMKIGSQTFKNTYSQKQLSNKNIASDEEFSQKQSNSIRSSNRYVININKFDSSKDPNLLMTQQDLDIEQMSSYIQEQKSDLTNSFDDNDKDSQRPSSQYESEQMLGTKDDKKFMLKGIDPFNMSSEGNTSYQRRFIENQSDSQSQQDIKKQINSNYEDNQVSEGSSNINDDTQQNIDQDDQGQSQNTQKQNSYSQNS